MRLTLKQIKKMNVETVSHTRLGSVADIILDAETHAIVQYCVTSGIISGHEYLIHPSQVVRFEQNKMIVDDAALHDDEHSANDAHLRSPLPEAVLQESP